MADKHAERRKVAIAGLASKAQQGHVPQTTVHGEIGDPGESGNVPESYVSMFLYPDVLLCNFYKIAQAAY